VSASEKTATEQAAAAEAHWRTGIVLWHRTMLRALDGISLIFSRPGSLSTLQKPSSRLSATLGTFELTLAGCSATVRKLGPVPPALATAGKYALDACHSLERGEQLIESAMVELRKTDLNDPLNQVSPLKSAADPLAAGQNEMVTVTHAMQSPT
jgi:hypothetical protein